MSKKVSDKKELSAEGAKLQKTGKAAPAPNSEKKKRDEKGVNALYKIEGEKVMRLRPTCERCGSGYFMADHNDRYTCGHCGFTRYKKA